MADEYVDVIDEKDRITGLEPKVVVHLRGLRHRVAAVLLQRADGKYLIPTASRIKAEAGLLYHSAAGHVLSAESYVETPPGASFWRKQDCQQALSNISDLSGLKKEYSSRTEKERFHVYRATYRGSMWPVKLNEEQVDEQWLNHGELEAIYRKKRESISAPLLMTCKHIFWF